MVAHLILNPRLHQQAGGLTAFVGFDVGPQPLHIINRSREPGDILRHPLRVNHQRGCIKPVGIGNSVPGREIGVHRVGQVVWVEHRKHNAGRVGCCGPGWRLIRLLAQRQIA